MISLQEQNSRPSEEKLTVFNIQRYSLHDGNGIRTTVFLKGCPLRCRWCCNPESQSFSRELMYSSFRCIGKDECGFCKKACSGSAVSFDETGKATINFSQCTQCLECAKVCPSKALNGVGSQMTVEEIIREVLRDAVFFRNGNGGVTLSGGEPLAQRGAVSLLREAKKQHIKTAVETCGHVDFEVLKEANHYLDEVYYDLKSLDENRHIEYTGCSNALILGNLINLCKIRSLPITVRTPVIPGFNDNESSLREIENFVGNLCGDIQWQKMPYHVYGAGKYAMLGRIYEME